MIQRRLITLWSLAQTSTRARGGFAFEAKLGYYRGLGLSMIEDLAISIDGEPVARSAIRFDEGPGAVTLDEMETALDRRWAFGASAVISVAHAGGLAPGQHTLSLTERLRVSYLPFPALNSISKSLEIIWIDFQAIAGGSKRRWRNSPAINEMHRLLACTPYCTG